MKKVIWIFWILAICICVTEARYKMRRPLSPPSQSGPQMYKKSWPIGHRMSIGNTIHINGNFGPKRPHYKPANYRIRRPPVYNVLPTAWKSQVPVLGVINSHGVLPQRPPVKEFHSMNKVPEYSPEYRPETAVMPPTHRGGMDDDKGAIHTIPAPNLSLADKPYNLLEANPSESHEDQSSHRYQYSNNPQYNLNQQPTNYGFGSLVTSAPPQRTVTSPISTQNQYEVTETNEIGSRDYQTGQPGFFTPEIDSTRLPSLNLDVQTNELYINHPGVINPLKSGVIGGNIQFGANGPMHTNLHSSLHVGFPGSAAQAPQISDHQVGHPGSAGSPLSAAQLYDLLNSFPQQVKEEYAGQQAHIHEEIVQQQLGQQLFQPSGESFSQPQMHSFNYDEQANKRQRQQQQQVVLEQDYGSGRVTADYNLEPEAAGNVPIAETHVEAPASAGDEEIVYRGGSESSDNHIEYEESSEAGEKTYFSKVGTADEGSISTQFFTSLPNKEAAEKLAALAAAGNVNSQLIGQLRKQQQQKRFEDDEIPQSDEPVPSNHKVNNYEVNEPVYEDSYQSRQRHYEDQRLDEQQKQFDHQQFNRQRYRHQQIRQQQEMNERYAQQMLGQQQEEEEEEEKSQEENTEETKKRPMRIMVPDVEEYTEQNSQRTLAEADNTNEDYDYENPDPDPANTKTTASSSGIRSTYEENSSSEFGTRLTAKKIQ